MHPTSYHVRSRDVNTHSTASLGAQGSSATHGNGWNPGMRLFDIEVMDKVQTVGKLKWQWAGHLCHRTEDRWNRQFLEWRPRTGKRNVAGLRLADAMTCKGSLVRNK